MSPSPSIVPVSEPASAVKLKLSAPSPPFRSAVVAAENPVPHWTTERLRQEEKKQDLRERMMQAGLYTPGATAVFFVVRMALLIGPAALGFEASRMGYVPLTKGMLAEGYTSKEIADRLKAGGYLLKNTPPARLLESISEVVRKRNVDDKLQAQFKSEAVANQGPPGRHRPIDGEPPKPTSVSGDTRAAGA